MRKIEFHNREREIKEFMNILNIEPALITFIYGPINSGKTELINHLIKQLPENYVIFNVNLRGKFISDYKDFVRALFKIEREKENYKEILRTISEVSIKALNFVGIPVTEDVLNLLFKERTYEDVFEFLEDYFTKIGENKNSVLIVDELQVIGDVKVDELLIYKLFNFFVRLTKELHLTHMFAVSSDSLFIERIYNEAMLQGRCDYFLVDDFDYDATMKFLSLYQFKNNEKELVWEYCGGKPSYLIKLINAKISGKNTEEVVNDMWVLRTGEIETMLKMVEELGDEITIESKSYAVSYEKLVATLKEFVNKDEIDMSEIDEISKRYLVKKNVLFVDPLKKRIKTQSRLDLIAIREVVKDA